MKKRHGMNVDYRILRKICSKQKSKNNFKYKNCYKDKKKKKNKYNKHRK